MKDFYAEINELKNKQMELFGKRNILDKKISAYRVKIDKLVAEKEAIEMSKPMSKEEEIKYYLFEDGSVSGERYNKRSSFWEDKGFWVSGYYPETQQSAIKLMLYKGEKDNLESTTNGLIEILPFVKTQNGVKVFGIFEHTLSEDGSYSIEVSDDTFADLVVHRYGRKCLVKSFSNIPEMVAYVQEYHYYESSIDGEGE